MGKQKKRHEICHFFLLYIITNIYLKMCSFQQCFGSHSKNFFTLRKYLICNWKSMAKLHHVTIRCPAPENDPYLHWTAPIHVKHTPYFNMLIPHKPRKKQTMLFKHLQSSGGGWNFSTFFGATCAANSHAVSVTDTLTLTPNMTVNAQQDIPCHRRLTISHADDDNALFTASMHTLEPFMLAQSMISTCGKRSQCPTLPTESCM